MDNSPWRGVPRMSSARVRIGVAFSSLALLLFGAVGMLSASDARRQSERDSTAALQQFADQLALRLDADMAARHRDIEQLVRLHELLELNPGIARWQEMLERLQQSAPHYSWIGLADMDGKVLAATQGILVGADVAQRPWFGKGRLRTSLTDVHEAKLLAKLLPNATGEPLRFVDVSAPLRQQGRTVGVIGAHLSWAWAEQRRKEAMAGGGSRRDIEIVLIDHKATIELGPRTPALQPATPELVKALLSAPQALAWSDGKRYMSAASASKPTTDYPGMGWVVVVRQPEHLALADAIALERRLIWLSALGVALFGALGWVLADRLTRPLRHVAAQAQALLPQGQDLSPHDEVDQLARTLASLLADLKQREQALSTLNEALESRVQARTESLRLANEDLRAFSRSISHDIQGPLGSMAQLLKQALLREQGSLPSHSAQVMQTVEQECARLKELSAELLALAVVEQSQLSEAPVDHHALVQAVIAQLRAGHPGPFPTVEVGALPTLPGDPVMLRQVWSNLLSNAVKFSAKSASPRIEVHADFSGSDVLFTVSDNGVGFDEARRDRLFCVFQRLHAPSQFPGTGVGLSIVRRVVERHGGRVWADSPPGQGARFHFSLPGAHARAGAEEALAA